jgi:hypothetical protein
MKFENTEVFNFDGAFRGMRNPKNSWDKGDSGYGCYDGAIKGLCRDCDGNPKAYCALREYVIGQNDLALAQSLIKAGSEHRKFMRQIFVSVDITAPLYWWKEFDTYKVGTVANSTSTMHKLASTPITKDCFEMDDFEDVSDIDTFGFVSDWWDNNVYYLEELRQKYNETKDIRYWKELIRLLPESWLQKRTVTMDYENLLAICSKGQRRFHKLTEWSRAFIDWARTLPYAKELIFIDELEEKKNGKM